MKDIRRHSKIEFINKNGFKYAKKKYKDNEQFEREIEGYERLYKLLDSVRHVESGNILSKDSENRTINIEYVEGTTLSEGLVNISSREWEKLSDILSEVIGLATLNEVYFDCDPSNILIVENSGNHKLLFIDPECIEVKFKPFAASVFFIGLYKLMIKNLIRPQSANDIFKKTLVINSKLKPSLDIAGVSLIKGMSKYSWYCATSNIKIQGYDSFTKRMFRILIFTPFWIFSAFLFRLLSIRG